VRASAPREPNQRVDTLDELDAWAAFSTLLLVLFGAAVLRVVLTGFGTRVGLAMFGFLPIIAVTAIIEAGRRHR
jgi:hypothetical protein